MDVRFDETNGSQRELLPSTLDEAPSSESIKLMGTGEIIPSEAQPEEELIISAPNNLKTMLRLKTILPMMTMISMSKVFVQFILVFQMKYKLRR